MIGVSCRRHLSVLVRRPGAGRLLRMGVVALCGAAIVAPTPARADTGRDDDPYYTFEDDPLDAVGHDALGAVLHIRPGAARTLLIRPRVQFVAELLSTVEQM